MTGLKKTILGISDMKNLFQSLNNTYSLDLSNYALSSLKSRVEDFMLNYHFSSIDELIHKVESDLSFFQMLLNKVLVETTEMFRDPEFWNFLKINILSRTNYQNDLKIWIPECNSGEELYTLQIIIHQLNLQQKSKVCLTTLSALNIERISKASLEIKKMEINSANFERYQEQGKLEEYFSNKSNSFKLNPEYIENTEIISHNLFTDKIPGIFDLIIFRNKMLYYNPSLKIDALKILNTALKPGGYIAIGIKESLDFPAWEQEYIVVSESERIYKKVIK